MKKVYLLLICLSVIGSGNMFGQDNQIIELAEAAVANFRCSVTEVNYKFYGLSSPKALDEVRVGEAISHRGVKLNELQDYTEDQDPLSIIGDMGYTTVALTKNDGKEVESFVLLNKRDNKYQVTGMGQDSYSLNYLTYKGSSDLGKQSTLIRIPALNTAYAGVMIEGVLNLVPLDSREAKGSEPRPANIVFAEIASNLDIKEDVPH